MVIKRLKASKEVLTADLLAAVEQKLNWLFVLWELLLALFWLNQRRNIY